MTVHIATANHSATTRRSARQLIIIGLAALSLIVTPRTAAAQKAGEKDSDTQNQRWTAIREVFGQGEAEGHYFRVNLPRTDLHVRIAGDTLSPAFEFTSYVGFAPVGARDVFAMGEVILLQAELPAVLDEARRQGVQVSAVHNHLIGEEPRIVYVHVMDEGAPRSVATALRAVFAQSATPLTPRAEEPSRGDWSAVDAVLGRHSEAEGDVAEYVFPRKERIRVHGMMLESSGSLETASEVVFQHLTGSRVANTGELYLLPGEAGPVVRALEEHGLHVTALHNHMLDDGPPHFWVHWYATGDGPTLARGVAAALAQMNSARKAVQEGGE